jgi:acyl carrier protein
VNNYSHVPDSLLSRLKELIANLFRMDLLEPDKIADHTPLIGGSLGLDSLDVLELAFCIEEIFGVTLHHRDGSLRAFASIASLADFIEASTQANHIRSQSAVVASVVFQVRVSPTPA